MTEAYMNIQSDYGRRHEAPNVGRWWNLYSSEPAHPGFLRWLQIRAALTLGSLGVLAIQCVNDAHHDATHTLGTWYTALVGRRSKSDRSDTGENFFD